MKKKFLSTTFLILSLLMINVLIFNKYTNKSIDAAGTDYNRPCTVVSDALAPQRDGFWRRRSSVDGTRYRAASHPVCRCEHPADSSLRGCFRHDWLGGPDHTAFFAYDRGPQLQSAAAGVFPDRSCFHAGRGQYRPGRIYNGNSPGHSDVHRRRAIFCIPAI